MENKDKKKNGEIIVLNKKVSELNKIINLR
jgi:hypothetical protein